MPLFGGVAGAALGVPEFEVTKGLVLRQTYAHVMAPVTMAFKRPSAADRWHPAPWKPTRGGFFTDVEIEVALDASVRPTNFDRLNTLWWVLALLRVSTGAALRMPVIADISFAEIAASEREPVIWTMEARSSQLKMAPATPQVIDIEHLIWLREALGPGAKLMGEESFGRALQAFDDAIWAHSTGSALVTVWAAMETLIRPGRSNITKRLASAIAAMLQPPGAERERLFQQVASLYEARGGAVHASRLPYADQLFSSFEIARRTFVRCIDAEALPDAEQLQEMWRLRT